MNDFLKKHKDTDFDEFGYETMLRCRDDEEHAKHICAQRIQSYDLSLQPQIGTLESEIQRNTNHATSLREHLYDRSAPVNDAEMLTHSEKIRTATLLVILAAIAAFAGNTITFYLFGFGVLLTVIVAAGTTGFPVVVGHYAYEQIVEKYKTLQNAIITIVAVLCFAGLCILGGARILMADKAAAEASPTSNPYVDGSSTTDPADQDVKPAADTESKVRAAFGIASFSIMLAADLMLGFSFGRRSTLLADKDYKAWKDLKKLTQLSTALKERVSHLLLSIEIAKKQCTEGILRAQVELKQRRTPYHGPLAALALFALLAALPAQSQAMVESTLVTPAISHASVRTVTVPAPALVPSSFRPVTSESQTIERYEGILIDTSGSISRNGVTNELFRQYLVSTKKLLITETPSTRVWVSSIAVDSFGGDGTLVKGWTPESRGIFTDNLNRARRELASAFEQKSSRLSPVANGTDIFGALWRFSTLFESAGSSGKGATKTIWIFSDMMNETNTFLMPSLLPLGPEQMLERAKANRLIVPMNGYKVYVYGATLNGLSPQAWHTVKDFWTLYFHAAGAELVTYSPECEVQR